MNLLVIGSGGREHALVWKLRQNPKVKKIYCVPGNGGIQAEAECVALSSENIESLIEFVENKSVHLTIVGPEVPLSHGIVDAFEKSGHKIFGPRKNAAILEFSKCYTKEFCTKYRIPTAGYTFFHNASDAKAVFEKHPKFPVVLKADGLAQGKGVIIAKTKEEAIKAVEDMMVHERFGEAGKTVILEEFMPGEEATFMVVTDGEDYVALESAQDHKRAFDNDEGPNTGGMGAYSPAPILTKALQKKVEAEIIKPLLEGMKKEGRTYRGILYAGLMISGGEARLVEFNCRFGDPEAQAILFRMESDLVELVEAVLEGRLKDYPIRFSPQPAVCVVMAAKGYPGSYEKNKVIRGLDKAAKSKNAFVFHAGTRLDDGQYLTNGGRVLGVTARGANLKAAIQNAYAAVESINWDGAFYRKDIGKKGL